MEMTDKELLKMAAKAAGLEFHPVYSDQEFLGYMTSPGSWTGGWFDPLTDDGDALRLMVQLRLPVEFPSDKPYGPDRVFVSNGYGVVEDVTDDPYAATRRAIVRAASHIGKGMK
jgi:hypothetical protein